MSYARLRADILATRDARETALGAILGESGLTVVFASAVVPGPRKDLPGIDALLRWGLARLERRIDACRLLSSGSDLLGPYAFVSLAVEPDTAKRHCINIEKSHPAARLLDLDVYGANTARVGRADVGEPPRPCLLCEQPAADCIRLGRHPLEALLERIEYLLNAFDHPATR